MVVGVEAVVPVVAGAAAFTSDTEFILDNNGRTAAGEECNLASTDIERMIVAEPLLPPEAETTGGKSTDPNALNQDVHMEKELPRQHCAHN